MLHTIFKAVLAMSVTGSILTILLLGLKSITIKHFSARWNYYITWTVVVFLLVPIGIRAGADSDFKEHEMLQFIQVENIYPHFTDESLEGAELKNKDLRLSLEGKNMGPITPIMPFLPYVWLLGVLGWTTYRYGTYLRFKRKILRTSLSMEESRAYGLMQECKEDMGIRKAIPLLSNELIDTPMMIGLLRPCLILPEVKLTDQELRVILQHELIHFKRKDLWLKAGAFLVNGIHWFNPLVYRLVNHINELCELSCDEQVVKAMGMEERQFYGEIILNLMSWGVNRKAGIYTTLCDNRRGIERRLVMIMKKRKVSKKVMAISMGLGLSLMITGTVMAKNVVPVIDENVVFDNYVENQNEPFDFEGFKALYQETVNAMTADNEYRHAPEKISRIDLFFQVYYQDKEPINLDEMEPLKFPSNYDRISAPYGERIHPVTGDSYFHDGIDIPAPTGTEIFAAQDGTVIATYEELGMNGYGNYVILDHGNGTGSLYAHCDTLNVALGDTVKMGDKIAEVGSTGNSTGPHLHFEFRVKGEPVNPMDYMTKIE